MSEAEGVSTRKACAGVHDHRPSPLRIVRHHWFPKGWGGPDVEANLIDVCDVCHYGTHKVLDVFRRAGRVLSPAEVRAALALPDDVGLARIMYDTARRGFEAWEAAGRPRALAGAGDTSAPPSAWGDYFDELQQET